jgi:hypothetical protein
MKGLECFVSFRNRLPLLEKVHNKMKNKYIILLVGISIFIATCSIHLYTWYSVQKQLVSTSQIDLDPLSELICIGQKYEINHFPFYLVGSIALLALIYGFTIQDRFIARNLIGTLLCLLAIILCLMPLTELLVAYYY